MRETGIKDKNGRKICEGDIFHVGDEKILYFVEDCELKGKQIKSNSWIGLEHWKDKIEVIGNIYDLQKNFY
ncbi:hypothetical protein EPT53_09220 [Fusobacterium necrophorum]|uniref:YopX protein domain-containing protein n=1 Tax=Fusobacterium necrophorum TaxID=859 RepID=A0A4Q2KXE9_9FUSO|nr:YopX family protein [Fusobacterium necrophorum]RXZ68583.1 hypothetical protein EPT53_09220 [Fusobacterium necrophorum]